MIARLPLAVLAGVSLGAHQRSNRWKPRRGGWEVRVLPSQQYGRADLHGVWKRLLSYYDSNSEAANGIHLLLLHDREDERPQFNRELGLRSIRAVWLAPGMSTQYGSGPFEQVVDHLLGFEETWRTRIRPELNSPLVLPETGFSAQRDVRDTWRRARKVNDARDDIDAVAKSIERFADRHKHGQGWRDARQLVFRRGAPHGEHGLPSWRKQKLTFRLPEGHHFDVTHERGSAFHIEDEGGASRKFARYTNVDSHGFVRGGR